MRQPDRVKRESKKMNKCAATMAAIIYAVTLSLFPATVHAASADEAQIKAVKVRNQ